MKPTKHARLRCIQRKGVHLSKSLHSFFIDQIQNQKAMFIKRSSLTRTLWKVVDKDGYFYKVVYSNTSKSIITVLPDDKNYISDRLSYQINKRNSQNNVFNDAKGIKKCV